MLLREIITPQDSTITMQLPPEMVGKTVEVIAFEIDSPSQDISLSREERIDRIQKLTNESRVDLSSFKFNRDEANNYDE